MTDISKEDAGLMPKEVVSDISEEDVARAIVLALINDNLLSHSAFTAAQRIVLFLIRSRSTGERAGWRTIESAPKMKNVMLWAATDIGADGEIKNWKMATGYWSGGKNTWEWEGRPLKPYDIQPTHWMPNPSPPAIGEPTDEVHRVGEYVADYTMPTPEELAERCPATASDPGLSVGSPVVERLSNLAEAKYKQTSEMANTIDALRSELERVKAGKAAAFRQADHARAEAARMREALEIALIDMRRARDLFATMNKCTEAMTLNDGIKQVKAALSPPSEKPPTEPKGDA